MITTADIDHIQHEKDNIDEQNDKVESTAESESTVVIEAAMIAKWSAVPRTAHQTANDGAEYDLDDLDDGTIRFEIQIGRFVMMR